MKFKTLLMAFVLSISSITAFATDTQSYNLPGYSAPKVPAASFSAILFDDSIIVAGLSDISGSFSSTPTDGFGRSTFTPTFTSLSLYDASFNLVTSVLSSSTFSFSNITAGTYYLGASGSLALPTGPKKATFGTISAEYSVTAVPEPKTSGMFLAGLGIIGFIASRRKSLI